MLLCIVKYLSFISTSFGVYIKKPRYFFGNKLPFKNIQRVFTVYHLQNIFMIKEYKF